MNINDVNQIFNSKNTPDVLDQFEAKIETFGGRRFSCKGFEGTVDFKTLWNKTMEKLEKSEGLNTEQKLAYVQKLKSLNLQADALLQKSNIFKRILTSVRQYIGNRGFDKRTALERLNNLENGLLLDVQLNKQAMTPEKAQVETCKIRYRQACLLMEGRDVHQPLEDSVEYEVLQNAIKTSALFLDAHIDISTPQEMKEHLEEIIFPMEKNPSHLALLLTYTTNPRARNAIENYLDKQDKIALELCEQRYKQAYQVAAEMDSVPAMQLLKGAIASNAKFLEKYGEEYPEDVFSPKMERYIGRVVDSMKDRPEHLAMLLSHMNHSNVKGAVENYLSAHFNASYQEALAILQNPEHRIWGPLILRDMKDDEIAYQRKLLQPIGACIEFYVKKDRSFLNQSEEINEYIRDFLDENIHEPQRIVLLIDILQSKEAKLVVKEKIKDHFLELPPLLSEAVNSPSESSKKLY